MRTDDRSAPRDPRGQRALRLGVGTALPQGFEGLDERGGVIWSNQPVVDRVLQAVWISRPFGKTLRQRGNIEVEYELVEPCAVPRGHPLQVLNERGSGEVLTYDEVESSAQLFAGHREGQSPGVQSRSRRVQ